MREREKKNRVGCLDIKIDKDREWEGGSESQRECSYVLDREGVEMREKTEGVT